MASVPHDQGQLSGVVPVTHWTRDYVGLPWVLAGRDRAAVDCWGLIWLIYRDVLSLSLPAYDAETVDAPERDEIASMIQGEQAASHWIPVSLGREQEFDMVVFRRAGIESHIGIVVARGQMLHVVDGADSCVERFDLGRWKSKISGIYRHSLRSESRCEA